MLLLNQASTDFLLNNLHAVSSFYWVLCLWVPSVARRPGSFDGLMFDVLGLNSDSLPRFLLYGGCA